MTLDELDAAFQADAINEDTYVLQDGATQWAKLGHVAGLDAPGASVTDTRDVSQVDFRPRKRGLVFGLATAVIVLGGLALAATTMTTITAPWDSAPPPVAAAAAPKQAAPLPAPVASTVDSAAAPVAVAATPSPAPEATRKGSLLADAKKRVLLDASKAHEAARKPHAVRRGKPGTPVFHEGGNKHDPLNANL